VVTERQISRCQSAAEASEVEVYKIDVGAGPVMVHRLDPLTLRAPSRYGWSRRGSFHLEWLTTR